MTVVAWFFPFFNGLFLGVLGMLLHEAAHLTMAVAVGVKVKNIGFCWKGLYTVREAGPPAKNLVISLAGPLMNLALIACWPISASFGLANLCFFAFNLLPLRGSDGERALICWSQMREARNASAQVRKVIQASSSRSIREYERSLRIGAAPQIGD